MYGREFAMSLATLSGTLAMPSIQWTDDGRPLVTPPTICRSEEQVPKWTDIEEWGLVSTYNPKVPEVVSGSVAGFTFRFPNIPANAVSLVESRYGLGEPTGELVEMMHVTVDDWGVSLLTWLDVLTQQDLDAEAPLRSLRRTGEGLSVWAVDEATMSLPTQPRQITIMMRNPSPISPGTFEWALSQTQAGVEPSTEHLLTERAGSDEPRTDQTSCDRCGLIR
jgi:hypothetical protein